MLNELRCNDNLPALGLGSDKKSQHAVLDREQSNLLSALTAQMARIEIELATALSIAQRLGMNKSALMDSSGRVARFADDLGGFVHRSHARTQEKYFSKNVRLREG